MGFQPEIYNDHSYCYDLIPILSEFLGIYDSDIPGSRSSESNFSTAVEDSYPQAAVNFRCNHDHGDLGEIHQQICRSEVSRRNVKRRMKWTCDLHERFVEIVNLLGGAEKARPKAILKLISSSSNMLTIYHVKSHLQKYRMSKCMEEYSKEKCGSASSVDASLELAMKRGMKIDEAWQQVNKSLLEQLEIQNNLQRLVEEQGKQLQVLLEQQEKTKKSLSLNSELPKSTCLNLEDDCGSIIDGSRSS